MKSDFPRQTTGRRPQVIEAACRDHRPEDDAGGGQGGQSPSRLDKTADDLRRDLSEIDVMLREALPQSAIEALEAELRKLADQVNGMGHAGVDMAALLPIERKLADMRDLLRALLPTENLFGLRQALQQLSHKLDRIGGSTRHSPALGQIASVLAGLRGIGSRVATSPVLARLSDDIRCLAASIELTSKLIEKVSATGAALARVEAIEHRVTNLDLECRRMSSLAYPTITDMDALAREVGDLRQAQKQTQDSLEGAHGSLGHVIARLAMIETEMRSRLSTRSASDLPAVASVAPAAAAILPLVAGAGEGATPEPGGAAASSPQTPTSGEQTSPERHSVDANPSADPPLASGPGHTRNPSSPADRLLGSEMTSAATEASIASGSKLDFIAAARRAVQATADRQAMAKNPVSTAAEVTSADTARRVRMWGALIGAITVVLVLFGGLQVARTLRSSAAEGGVEAPGPTVATHRPNPPTPPAATVTQRRLSAIEQLTPDLATPQPAQ